MGKRGRALRRAFGGILAAALALAVLLAGPVAAQCREDKVALRGDWGEAVFTVEVADDPAERSQGLMNRAEMARFDGMLFVYDRPQPGIAFWMKNTLIPLDMIFADATGTVRRVHARAVPGDLTPIPGGDGIQYVLEINGGLAALLGIGPGTQMQHPALTAAAWPCDN